MSQVTVKPLAGPYGLGEGPHWEHISQKLYFVDIFAQKIHRFDPATQTITSAFLGEYNKINCFVVFSTSNGHLIFLINREWTCFFCHTCCWHY